MSSSNLEDGGKAIVDREFPRCVSGSLGCGEQPGTFRHTTPSLVSTSDWVVVDKDKFLSDVQEIDDFLLQLDTEPTSGLYQSCGSS